MTKSKCHCKSKSSLDPNCPSCGGNGGKGGQGTPRQGYERGQEYDNGLLDCVDWSRLTPFLVFVTGSFLTIKLAAVAAQLG